MFLALGQRAFGSPFYGVLIGNALMLFTICLMLFAWVPPPWALAVSAMFALCLWPSMYWTNSYWGGSVAASGGAMVLLAIGMYRKKQTPLAGAVFALGALLLFWTRPYEGGVFTLAVLVVFARDLWRKRHATTIAVALLLLLAGGAWSCYYNQMITGNPLRLPYFEHEHQYNAYPELWILPFRPQPAYSHPRLAALYGTNGVGASMIKEKPAWLHLVIGVVVPITQLPLWIAVLVMLLVPMAWRELLYRKMAVVAGVVLLALIVENFHFAHYSAPAWAALALMIAVWAEHAWKYQIYGLPAGKALVLFALASPAIAGLSAVLSSPKGEAAIHPNGPGTGPANWPEHRVALIERLSALNGRQLVIVRYPSPDWNHPRGMGVQRR
jgi:hypothetical protein